MAKAIESSEATQVKRRMARESAAALESSVPSSGEIIRIKVAGKEVQAPDTLFPVLQSSLRLIGEGHAVAVVPLEQEIGTQEAAELLGVSRPHLVKLLDSGQIPFRKVGVQRRVLAGDVLAYREAEKARRRVVLAELAAEDKKLGLHQ